MNWKNLAYAFGEESFSLWWFIPITRMSEKNVEEEFFFENEE